MTAGGPMSEFERVPKETGATDKSASTDDVSRAGSRPVEPPMSTLIRRVARSGPTVGRADGPRVQRSAQAPLTVGAADDAHEREADTMAAAVVRRLHTPDDVAGELPAPRASGRVRRSNFSPSVDRRAAVGLEGGELDHETSTKIERARSGGKPLAAPIRRSMEGAFGADFSGVRVHDDQRASELSSGIQAEAFTTGSHIFFNGGAPDVTSPAGQELLAHELAHTLQQSAAPQAQRRIQRRYLDREKNWVADTEYVGLFGIGTKKRSKPLIDIDNAVDAWNQAYAVGNTTYLQLAAQSILDKITAWEAKKGKGTDESMRGDDFRILRDEATEWLNKLQTWNGQHAAVAARHDRHRRRLQRWVDEGRAQTADVRLQNACEWVGTGKTRLFVVSEAPGPRERAAAIKNRTLASMPDDTRAYFPDPFAGAAGMLGAPAALYDTTNIRSNHNLSLDEEGAGTKGWNVANDHIAITEEGIGDGKAAAWGTIKHEVQHDADKHKGSELAEGIAAEGRRKTAAETQAGVLYQTWEQAYAAVQANDNAVTQAANNDAQAAYNTFTTSAEYTDRDARIKSEQALQGYKTEYRAHFYEGRANFESETHDPTDQITRLGMQWTKRQWAIFANIFDNYGYVEAAWGDHTDADPPTAVQTAFRVAVNAYWNPDTEGFNKYDSARVDDLYRALDAVPVGTDDAANGDVVNVLAVARKLNENDMRYLVDRAQAVMFNAKIDRHLDGAARDALRTFLTEEVDEWDTGLAIAGLFS